VDVADAPWSPFEEPQPLTATASSATTIAGPRIAPPLPEVDDTTMNGRREDQRATTRLDSNGPHEGENVMKRQKPNRRLIATAVAAVGVAAAPAAHAEGGAVGHRYAPPPLDAGSSLPNPVYVKSIHVDTGTSSGFDWNDGAAGAGAGLVLVAAAVGAVVATRRTRSRAAT
jgi:hypothetical protein